jgi:hypothetical protein
MHKKPLVAVFVLGLLLTATVFGWAAPVPPEDGLFLRESGRDKAAPAQRVEETGTPISYQTGTPLSVQGTFCNGYWQGPQTYRIPGWMTGGESYAVFQDPTSVYPYSFGTGCDAMIPPDLTFNVTATVWRWTKRPTSEGFINPYTYQIQPVIFDADFTNPACPVPGGVKSAGLVYLVTLNNTQASGGMTYELNLPFTVEACVIGPYFIGAYLPVVFDPLNGAQILTDDGGFYWPGPVVGQLCRTYNDYGAGWCDLNDPAQCAWFELNLLMWSEGYVPLDPATQCTPGLCDYQYWYDGVRQNDDWTNGYGLPTATRKKMGVRFMSDCQDTLKSVSFGLYGPFTSGAPDVVVEVWAGDDLAGSSCGVSPLPGTLLESVLVPYASLVFYPLVNDVVLSDHVWGTLNGGLPEAIFVTISEASDGVNGATAIQAGPPVTVGCPVDPHSIAFYAPTSALPGWHYLAEFPTAYTQREFWMDAYICKEQCPIVEDVCAVPGPDDWNTFAHDYQRTSASSMNLGDPCEIRAQWSTFMPRLSNFTNPVIAGGKVYVSSDNEVNSYDLATGAPGNMVGAFPYTGGQVRSNVSVEGNRVFLTGGTGTSISCWDTTLTTAFWSNDVTSGVLGLGSNGPLATRNRFGSAAVYAVGADSIVVVSTEKTSVSNSGLLYALDVTTGFLYAGWGANNPIVLDKGAFHAPAFDGTNLYVGTADHNLQNGSIYSINAATGLQNWNYVNVAALDEGFPGGVSIDGDVVYAASMFDQVTDRGHRYAIDKTTGVPLWSFLQGGVIFAAPTIGRNFVYIPQNVPSAGVLMVDKALGKAVYNWAAVGVGPVSGPVTLTCDKYLFAGDRNGYWYLLNATDQSMEWRREFTGIVNGTALAHHAITGDDYVVVSARSSWTGPAGAGVITGWRLNQTPRPFLRQLVYSTAEILVPLNSGDNLGPYTESGVYANDGCVGLNITVTNLHDPAPTAKAFSQIQQKYAAAYIDLKIGSDYVTYFEGGQPSKKARLAGAGVTADEELTTFDKALEAAHNSFTAKGARSATVAGAMDILRTHPVTYSANPILPGGTTDLTWLYDGTDLGRGVDDEYIESVTDDPDFYPEDLGYVNGMNYPANYPILIVHYIGGCPEENTTITWNTLGAPNVEKVWNHGAMGDSDPGTLTWGADANWNTSIFDGTFMIMGDSSATIGGAQMYLDYYDFHKLFVPDPRLSDAVCGFDGGTDVHMGWRRDGGCPGTPVEILGSWVQSGYSDTNFNFAPTSLMATIGTQIRQTEIGANDPMYGDFKLLQWKVNNRDAVAKTGLKGATYFDWDVATGGIDVGMVSDNFNGYALWDGKAPRYAYGMFDPNQPTAYCGVDPTAFSPYKIYTSASTIVYNHTPGRWVGDGQPLDQAYGWYLCTREPFRFVEVTIPAGEDRGGWLVSNPFDLDPLGSNEVIQAMYAVPAVSNTDAGIEALAVEVAKRAARWSGFARGDVNDDGCVDLGDVCWVASTNQIYPDTYCGDVNLDGVVDGVDQAYLLAYVSGLGPAPLGKFRFAY